VASLLVSDRVHIALRLVRTCKNVQYAPPCAGGVDSAGIEAEFQSIAAQDSKVGRVPGSKLAPAKSSDPEI
jgi:hypothetical protein